MDPIAQEGVPGAFRKASFGMVYLLYSISRRCPCDRRDDGLTYGSYAVGDRRWWSLFPGSGLLRSPWKEAPSHPRGEIYGLADLPINKNFVYKL